MARAESYGDIARLEQLLDEHANIAALDPDYRWSLVIGPDTGYAWILSRHKTLPVGIREQLVRQAAAVGIDTSALIWVQHSR